jgi:SAM-dependent methyltransferase
MSYLGYTEEEIDIAGSDAFNYQGVGNPLRHANIQPGERVLDVGSGLGIDSILASHHAGPEGKVIGIDISQREVIHAQARAHERGLDIRFSVSDMESIPLPDNCMDVVISNGAFCLSPNKERAFAELYRVLKPGGRIAVCTTTILSEKLDKNVKWPLCMRMFIAKDELEPMCARVGYVNVVIDDTDSKMTYDFPAELQELNPDRNRVHIGSKEFEHLQEYDMDDICARVCVVAQKQVGVPLQAQPEPPVGLEATE